MKARHFSILLGLITFSPLVMADHPNEGKIVMAQLIDEASQNSLELKQAEDNLQSLKSRSRSLYGSFSPKLSLEGGPQTSKFDGEKESGTAVYGKAEWNLFNGWIDKSNLDLLSDEVNLQEKRVLLVKNKIYREVAKNYYEMQFLLESISLKEKALAMNAQQMKIAKARNSSGFTTSSDVLEFDLRESTLNSDIVLLNRQLAQKSRELDVILSRENPSSLQAVKGHLERETFKINRNDLLAKLQKNNEELLVSRLEKKKIESEKTLARSQFLPKLDVEAKYGKLASEETVYENNDNYSVMLRMSIPLFSGFEDYNSFKSSKAKLASVEKANSQKVIQLTSDLDSALDEIKTLNERLDLEEKNLERSEKYYKLTLDEYKRGIKNSPDVVGASERLIEARIRNLEYRRDLMLAQTKSKSLPASKTTDPIWPIVFL